MDHFMWFECQNLSFIMIFATERNHQRKDKRWVTKEGLCSDHYFSLFHSKAVPDWQHDACQTAPIVVLDRTNTGLSTNLLLWPTSYLFFDGLFLSVSFVSSTFLSTVLKLLHSNIVITISSLPFIVFITTTRFIL